MYVSVHVALSACRDAVVFCHFPPKGSPPPLSASVHWGLSPSPCVHMNGVGQGSIPHFPRWDWVWICSVFLSSVRMGAAGSPPPSPGVAS